MFSSRCGKRDCTGIKGGGEAKAFVAEDLDSFLEGGIDRPFSTKEKKKEGKGGKMNSWSTRWMGAVEEKCLPLVT